MDTELGERKEALREMVRRVATITTLLDPDGIKLRFINFKEDGSFNNIRTIEEVDAIFDEMYFGKHTMIGTTMRDKILEPLFFAKIKEGSRIRPLLITTITDGEVWIEPHSSQVQDLLKRGI